MIFLFGAILFNTIRTFVMKYSESHDGNRYGVTVFNYVTGTLLGYLFLEDKSLLSVCTGKGFVLGFAGINSFLFVAVLLLMQYNVHRNGAPLTTTFSRMGLIIPILASAVLFGEIPTMVKIIGILISLGAIIYMNGGGKGGDAEEEYNVQKRSYGSLIILLLCGGSEELMNKLFNVFGQMADQEAFIFYTFFFSTILSLGIFFAKNRSLTKRDMISGIMIGIPNQLAATFILKAAGEIPAYIVYPCYSAGVIFVVNLINYLVFKEKLSKRETTAIVAIAAALVLINL